MLLSPTVPQDLTERLWRLLRSEEASLTQALDELVIGMGGRLGSIPDFALAVSAPDDMMHVALRGSARLEVDGQALDASSVTTWLETAYASPRSVVARSPERSGSVYRPAADAVVVAGLLRLAVTVTVGRMALAASRGRQLPVPGSRTTTPTLSEPPLTGSGAGPGLSPTSPPPGPPAGLSTSVAAVPVRPWLPTVWALPRRTSRTPVRPRRHLGQGERLVGRHRRPSPPSVAAVRRRCLPRGRPVLAWRTRTQGGRGSRRTQRM
ncbi:hypothetical protein D5R93_11235 [Actinomyces lilanjuaniae]|uniref:Uncharacterized protein n=2 Tax=Actinomyces lilanjuaniae TaxID=2321394 RepID=A0ABN5PPU1_9ACTO|nr:hypothetical protein D5R93_11235 [Actinomyces lilanjuaniae]